MSKLKPIASNSLEVTEALINEFDGYPLDCIVAELLTLRRNTRADLTPGQVTAEKADGTGTVTGWYVYDGLNKKHLIFDWDSPDSKGHCIHKIDPPIELPKGGE